MQSHNYSVQKINKNSLNWVNQFQELLEYKKQYGNCNVPKRYDKNQPLATWVRNQRNQFKHSTLSEERINMLNSIGFNWSISKDSFWLDKFEELKRYKSNHGDCNVPARYQVNQPLATWVHKQRFQFNHSKLSEERINMLNTIGFIWRSVSKNSLWNDKFEELKQYKSKHGDCNIPPRYDGNQALANWVHLQRFYFKHSKISKKRITMLNGIGFSWTAPKRKEKPRQLKNHEQIAIETSYQDSNEKEEQLVDNEIDTEQEDSDIKECHEQIAIETEQEDTELKGVEENHEQIAIETSYQDSNEKEEQLVDNEIDTEQEDSDIKECHEQIAIETEQEDTELKGVEENHEQIAIETSYQDSKEKEMTTEEKGEISSYKRSLQDRVEVLCKISLMFLEQKDVIHADMKRRKLGNSA